MERPRRSDARRLPNSPAQKQAGLRNQSGLEANRISLSRETGETSFLEYWQLFDHCIRQPVFDGDSGQNNACRVIVQIGLNHEKGKTSKYFDKKMGTKK